MKWKQPLAAALLLALSYVAFLAISSSRKSISHPKDLGAELEVPQAKVDAKPSHPEIAITKTERPRFSQPQKGSNPLINKALVMVPLLESNKLSMAPSELGSKVPRPDSAYFSVVKLKENGIPALCPIDRPCQPEGREGVLLLGVQIDLNPWGNLLSKAWGVGSYYDRSSLLVLK